MKKITQPLREEHEHLLPYIEQMRLTAESICEGEILAMTHKHLDDVYHFLVDHLLPHAQAEDKALYPVVQRIMGSDLSTATMSRDHEEIASLVNQLKIIRSEIIEGVPLAPEQATDLRRVLYGIYALVKNHFAKEEEIYMPLLDARLSADDAESMFDSMEKAQKENRQVIYL